MDIELALNCYEWELKALLKGSALRLLDERERLAILAANVGYFNNDKKPKFKKIFNKKKEEHSIDKAFSGQQHTEPDKAKVLNALHYFSQKGG
jgi:hypothetical protein